MPKTPGCTFVSEKCVDSIVNRVKKELGQSNGKASNSNFANFANFNSPNAKKIFASNSALSSHGRGRRGALSGSKSNNSPVSWGNVNSPVRSSARSSARSSKPTSRTVARNSSSSYKYKPLTSIGNFGRSVMRSMSPSRLLKSARNTTSRVLGKATNYSNQGRLYLKKRALENQKKHLERAQKHLGKLQGNVRSRVAQVARGNAIQRLPANSTSRFATTAVATLAAAKINQRTAQKQKLARLATSAANAATKLSSKRSSNAKSRANAGKDLITLSKDLITLSK